MNIHAIAGNNIRVLREQAGLSQEELAHLAGVNRAYLCGIEHGCRNVSLAKIEGIALALGVNICRIFLDDLTEVAPQFMQDEEHYLLCEKTQCGFEYYPLAVHDIVLSLRLLKMLSEEGYAGYDLLHRYEELESKIFGFAKRSIELDRLFRR